MRKIVNGTVVEIGNDVVDLFEKALEGNVTKRMLANKVETLLAFISVNISPLLFF